MHQTFFKDSNGDCTIGGTIRECTGDCNRCDIAVEYSIWGGKGDSESSVGESNER